LHFGLTRHALDRILFLLPIIYSSFIFGLIGGLATCFAALLVMLPRATFISSVPPDAILEVAGVTIVGILASVWLWKRGKEREAYRASLLALESAHALLQKYVRTARNTEKRLTTVNALFTVLNESLELQSVLRRAVHMIMELMDVEIVLIFSLDEKTQELQLIAYDGVSEEFARAVDGIKVGEGFNGEVARTAQPMVVDNTSLDPRLSRPEVKKMRIESQLIVPLILREHVRGTICVGMRRPKQFLAEEIELLGAVGGQIAAAMENSHLYEKERLTAEKLAISEKNYRELFENASDAIWVHDLAGNMVIANKACKQLTGYDVPELIGTNVRTFLSSESRNLAGEIRHKLINGEPVVQPYEQHLIRKDGTEAILMLTTSLVAEDENPVAFQHIARDVTEEKRMQENLHYYLNQITKAQEEERKRIARELHDDTSQILHALSRQADNFLRGSTHLGPEDVAFLNELRQKLNEALEGVRRFSQALRPPMLDDLGLIPAVRWLISEMEMFMKAAIELKVNGDERRLSSDAELTLFRTIQEALRNIWRHAEASRAEVNIDFLERRIRISVNDNGKGFGPPERIEDLPSEGKLGLTGIEERMRLLGGSMKVESEPGRGTTLIAEAPI